MNLDELEKLAKAARDKNYTWCAEYTGIPGGIAMRSACVESVTESYAAFIDKANPETVLKLIAVTRAAKNAQCSHRFEDCGAQTNEVNEALAALEES